MANKFRRCSQCGGPLTGLHAAQVYFGALFSEALEVNEELMGEMSAMVITLEMFGLGEVSDAADVLAFHAVHRYPEMNTASLTLYEEIQPAWKMHLKFMRSLPADEQEKGLTR